jgi:hypothetical protein
MGDIVEVVSETKKTKRGLRTTERKVPFHSSKQTKSGRASGSRQKADSYIEGVQAQASRQPSHETEEAHTLLFTDPQEDDILGCQTDDRQPQKDVRGIMLYWTNILMTRRIQWTNG